MSPHFLNRARELSTPVLLIAFLSLFVLVIGQFDDKSLARTMTELLIRVTLVVSLWIFAGNSGVVSFGHAGYMVIGAYASAWLTIKPAMKAILLHGLPSWLANAEWHVFPAILAAGALAAAVALISGVAILRLAGTAISIATFAFLAVVNTIYSNWESVTGATSSIVGLPRYVSMYVGLGWAAVVILVASMYARSAPGLALRASREDEVAAAASGIDIHRHRLLALVISAFFTGVGGALLGHFIGVLNPDSFYLDITFLVLAMLVLGGIGTLTGAVIGAVVVSVLIEMLIRLEHGVTIGATHLALPGGTQEIAIGAAMIICLIFRPSGIAGGKELRVPATWLRPFLKRQPIARLTSVGQIE